MSEENLKEYFRKRDFEQTTEPTGAKKRRTSSRLRFVIQKHHASHLHYDFRLEAGGTLKSWAVPKGPSLNPADKRLAMQVEDHPLDYYDFEGVIPEGNYGAGSVIVWDAGTYSLVEGQDPLKEIERGTIKFRLKGKKLQGIFALVKIRGRNNEKNTWLLIKDNDDVADRKWKIDEHGESIVSGRSVDEVAQNPRAKTWTSGAKAKNAPAGSKRAGKAQPLPKVALPMLATLVDAPFDDAAWLFEVKWDGFRAVCTIAADGSVTASSRNGKNMLAHFPELEELGRAFKTLPVVIDGEVVSLDAAGRPSFQNLQQRANRLRPTAKLLTAIPITFVVFDLLYADGRSLMSEPLEERKATLERILVAGSDVLYSKHVLGKGTELYDFAEKHDLEGVIGKRRGSPYVQRRSRDWVKIKAQKRQEFVIGGYTEPRGSRLGFGALILGVYEDGKLVYAGHVGTGFAGKTIDAIMKQLRPLAIKTSPFAVKIPTNTPAHWVQPQLIAEVRFTEWTNEGQLRHPAFLGLRDDKDPASIRRERALDADSVAASQEAPAKAAGAKETVETIDGHALKLTNLDKMLWPGDGFTKGDLIAYYRSVAKWILPHLRDRALTLERYPNGIDAPSFFEKDKPRGVPAWVETTRVLAESRRAPGKSNGLDFIVCNDEATLIYVANLASIVLHIWQSRLKTPDNPDFILFDLDPWECSMKTLAEVALGVRDVLYGIGLAPLVKTTGGYGLHVVVPLKPAYAYDQAKAFGELVARRLSDLMPQHITLEFSTKKRPKGTVYFDYLQVGKGKTLVVPYSVRPRPGAPVSTPLEWDEVEALARSRAKDTLSVLRQWNIKTVGARLKKHGDLWSDERWKEQRIEAALKKARTAWRDE